MAKQRQWPSDYDPNKKRLRNYEIPTLERRARSQNAGKTIPGLTENAFERKVADNKTAAKQKKYLAENSSRPVRTSATGGNNIKRTGLPADRRVTLEDLKTVNEREKGFKESYRKTLTAKVKSAKKRKN